MGWQMGARIGGKYVRLLKFIPEEADGSVSAAREAASQSMNFTHAWDRCFEERRNPNSSSKRIAIVPGVVCAAFAVELGFKAIIYKEGGDALQNGKRVHSLGALFAMLPAQVQADIISSTKLNRQFFELALNQVNHLFVNLRYYYEQKSPIQVDIEFVERLTLAVEPFVHKILNPKTATAD